MRKRSLARELALQMVYQSEFNNEVEIIVPSDFPYNDEEIERFARELVNGVKKKKEELDKIIESKAANWEINRMAVIDKVILRIATYEILFKPDIPEIVSINEAVDLAKKYGSEASGAFVNGILDNIFRSLDKND